MKNLTHFELKEIRAAIKNQKPILYRKFKIISIKRYSVHLFCLQQVDSISAFLDSIIMSETVNVKNTESLVSEKMDDEQENEPEKKMKKVRFEHLNLLSSTIVLGKKE